MASRRSIGRKMGCTVLFLLILAGMGVWTWIRNAWRDENLSPFAESLPAYLAVQPKDEEPSKEHWRPGIITIDAETGELDHFYFSLPEEMRASEPAAVKTVVFLHWGKDGSRGYSRNRIGYRQTCKVEVVDLQTKQLLQRSRLFKGDMPPLSISEGAKYGMGPRPVSDIIRFLRVKGG